MNTTNLNANIQTLCTLLQESKVKFAFESVGQTGMPHFSALARIGESAFEVHTTVDLLEQVPGFDFQGPHGSKWQVRDGAAILTVGTKVLLVEALKQLGVKAEDLKRVKSVKTSELRELVGDGGTNNEELETIMLRLQKKNDSIKIAIEDTKQSLGAYRGVAVDVSENYGSQLNYTLSVDCKQFINSEATKFRKMIECTGAKLLSGYLGHGR